MCPQEQRAKKKKQRAGQLPASSHETIHAAYNTYIDQRGTPVYYVPLVFDGTTCNSIVRERTRLCLCRVVCTKCNGLLGDREQESLFIVAYSRSLHYGTNVSAYQHNLGGNFIASQTCGVRAPVPANARIWLPSPHIAYCCLSRGAWVGTVV